MNVVGANRVAGRAAKLRGALWICDFFPRPHDPASGTWALESALALREAGVPVVVLAPTPWIPRPLALSRSLREWSRVPPEWAVEGLPIHYPRCPHYPRRWVTRSLYNRFPVLDTALLWPWIRRAADRLIDEQPFDVVHGNFLFPGGYLGMKLKQRYGTPLVVEEWSVQRLAMARQHRRRGRAYRRILRAADAVITLNNDMADTLREMEPDIRDLRVFRAHGAAPEKAGGFAQARPTDYEGRPVVLSVGALSERKGQEYLVRAVAELGAEFPGLTCRIIGDGPRRVHLQELIDRLDLGSTVELLGKRPHEEVLAAMSWCDVFALPSWGEAIGTVYGEAMQFGKPIVACVGEGITELVQDGVHGLLVSPRDVSGLAEALRRLLRDPGERERMGAKAKGLAAAELSYGKLARDLVDLYSELIRPGSQSQS